MRHFICVMREDRVWFIGPFESAEAAGKWGHKHWNPTGDPRWQVVGVDDRQIKVFEHGPREVVLPLYAPSSREAVL